MPNAERPAPLSDGLMPDDARTPGFALLTARLRLRPLAEDDAPFIVALLNEPSFLRYIGDRKVRTLEDAGAYVRNGPQASYARHGFGLLLVVRREDEAPIGMCGLLKRDALDDADLGFAFLPAAWGQGFASEAAAAVLAHGRTALGLRRVAAIVQPDNDASLRVLARIGFAFERLMRMPGEEKDIQLHTLTLS